MKPLLRIGLLLLLGLVLLARVLEHLNDRITAASRPPAPSVAEAAEAAQAIGSSQAPESGPAEPPPARPLPGAVDLPPPTDAQLDALTSGDDDAVRATLAELPSHAPTPELDAALAAAGAGTRWPGLRRRIACLRARDPGMPLADLFAALPAGPPEDVEWRQDDSACLVRALAARAAEDPDRALAVLAPYAVRSPSPPILEALARVDPPVLPASIEQALAPGTTPLRRSAAAEAAVAMGAAAKWSEQVRAWLDDADRGMRLATVRALAAHDDPASQALAARFIAANPGEEETRRLVETPFRGRPDLVPALVALVHDPAEPAFVRGVAARLVSAHGDEAACRLVAAVRASDATLAPALADASLRVTQRFGPAPGAGR